MQKSITLTVVITLLTLTTMAQKLKEKDKAPDFRMISAQEDTINLENLKGKTVLLAFFRFAGCPVCNFRMHELMENYESLKAKNIEVIAVFESGNETLKTYLSDNPIPFPVISDSALALYKKYSTDKSLFKVMRTMFKKKPKSEMKKGETLFKGKKYKQDGSMTRIPADFIIDEKGIIKIAHYGKFIGDHIPLETLIEIKK
jgi:thioredoxin-dependent peroxiredoxin